MNKDQLIAQCKSENPVILQTINGEEVELTGKDYENACLKWAEMRLEQMAYEQAIIQAESKKAAAEAKLAALGLTADDLKALGL